MENNPEDGIIPFLLGYGTLSGYWFDEDISPKFWWRGHLREHNASLQSEIDHLKEEKIELIKGLKFILKIQTEECDKPNSVIAIHAKDLLTRIK